MPALTAVPFEGTAEESYVIVTVVGSKFHVEVDLRVNLSIDDFSQFGDAEDAYSRDQGAFRGGLLESIESGVREHVAYASVTGLSISRIEYDESEREMFVELSFDVEGAIKEGDTTEYDLKWRKFIAVKKLSSADRRVQPAEALGLDFHDFKNELSDWTIKISSGNTVIERRETYKLNADDGEVDMALTMRFTLPGTGMTIGADTVTSKEAASGNGAGTPPPIPGFPWEAIGIGVALAVAVIITQRKHKPAAKAWRFRRYPSVLVDCCF
jgi:hypothetical protein